MLFFNFKKKIFNYTFNKITPRQFFTMKAETTLSWFFIIILQYYKY